MPIDDPYDAIEKQYIDESSPLFRKLMEVAGKGHFSLGVIQVLHKQFSFDATVERIKALIEQLIIDIKRHEEKIGKTVEIGAKLESPEFVETLLASVSESVRTTDHEKIKRFGAILGHSLVSTSNKSWDDAAGYIRDTSLLGERDIEALYILYKHQHNLFPKLENMGINQDEFLNRTYNVLSEVDRMEMSREEFYSRCFRLNGFGLVVEVPRNESKVSLGDHCFRITWRGRKFISMIKDID